MHWAYYYAIGSMHYFDLMSSWGRLGVWANWWKRNGELLFIKRILNPFSVLRVDTTRDSFWCQWSCNISNPLNNIFYNHHISETLCIMDFYVVRFRQDSFKTPIESMISWQIEAKAVQASNPLIWQLICILYRTCLVCNNMKRRKVTTLSVFVLIALFRLRNQ